VTQDDLLYRFRLRVFAIAAELGNVRAACRAMGIHPSTYYRWKRQLDRYGPEILRPRERRVPRMANATSVLVSQRVVGFALGHPGFGPARIAAELARPCWGGISLSTNEVWRVLRRHGLSTRAKRYGLVAGYAAPPQPARPQPAPERHLQVDHPGQLVQLDCFCIGRLAGTKGTVWQYTAIDVASAYAWATLQVTRRNPSAAWTSQLGPPGRCRPRRPRLEAGAGHERQRSRVPLGHLPADRDCAWRQAYLHPRRPAADERVRRASPADHPGGVLGGVRSPV
jgi:transposase